MAETSLKLTVSGPGSVLPKVAVTLPPKLWSVTLTMTQHQVLSTPFVLPAFLHVRSILSPTVQKKKQGKQLYRG